MRFSRHCLAASTVLAVLLVLTPLSASAQTDLERFERQIEQIHRDNDRVLSEIVSPLQRTLLDYGGYYTFSFAAIDDAAQSTHQFVQHELGAYARLNVDDVHEFFIRASTTYRDFKTGDAFDQHGDDWIGPKIDRATYRFDLRSALSVYADKDTKNNLVLQGGRQLVHWGTGLTLSQTIDGGIAQVTWFPFTIEFLAGLIRENTTDMDPFRPNFSDDSRRGFYGAKLDYQVLPRHTLYGYALMQDDNNNDPSRAEVVGGVATTTRFGYDSHYLGVGARGSLSDRLLYNVEAVYEGGKSYSGGYTGDPNYGTVTAVQSSRESIHAWAADARLDYLLTDENQTRFTGELVLASGDGDRAQYGNSSFGGNKPGTSDRGFNGFGLTNTGLAFAPAVTNLLLIRGGVSTNPFPNARFVKDLQVGMDVLVFNKLVPNGPVSENTTDDFYLGTEADIYANWRLTSDLAFSVRYGMFLPGTALSHANNGFGSDARFFFYSGMTLSF